MVWSVSFNRASDSTVHVKIHVHVHVHVHVYMYSVNYLLFLPLSDLISLLARLILATLPILKCRADRELILLWERSNTCKWERSCSLER